MDRRKDRGGFLLAFAAYAIVGGAIGCQNAASVERSAERSEAAAFGHAVFTVAESKRLIAKGVARMPVVQKALRDGMVIVCRGTTNTYVAEELLGRKIERGAFVLGRVTPANRKQAIPVVKAMPEVVLIKGEYHPEMKIEDALQRLAPGDVVIKGGNALDYAHKQVGVWTGSVTGGTTGKILGPIEERKAHLVIPIGLEKLVAGRLTEHVEDINEHAGDGSDLPRMRLLPGEIVTEIEALRILADVDAFQASGGGVAGAEGAVWMVWEGRRENVAKANALAKDIQGEPAFVPHSN